MKISFEMSLASILLSLAVLLQVAEPNRPVPEAKEPQVMQYIVQDGDTIYVDNIQPAWVFPRGSKINRTAWRKYTRLVYNFNKVYPYALLAPALIEEVDNNTEDMRRRDKNRYLSSVQSELLHNFESAIRKMTVSQGQLLMRLVDREVGVTGYDIIKDYRGRFSAGFWQGVAKLFRQNLKSRYDPLGEDKQTEELVKIWESGQWDNFYFSIFFEMPKKTEIPQAYQDKVKERR